VHLKPPPSTWVVPDPAAALEFVLAGALAEEGAYGHYAPGSFVGDLRIWRQGVGLLETQTTESFEAAAGVTVEDAKRHTKTWLVDAYPRIKAVVAALAGTQPGRTRSVVTFKSGPWSLTYQEVRELAAR
jgi:hypothetical protein